MQIWLDDILLLSVIIEILVAFLAIIAIGLYRFSRGLRYRLWSVAWILVTVSSLAIGLTTTGSGLTLSDGLASAGIMLSALLLVDGVKNKKRLGLYRLIYPAVYVIGFSVVPVGLVLDLSFRIVVIPVGVFTAYACWSSAILLRKTARTRNIDHWTLVIGLILWGVTMIIAPVNFFVDIFNLQIILLNTALIAIGAGMLNVYIRETSEDLRVQNTLTQLMASIINHDIRNYVWTLREAIDQAQTTGIGQKFWLDLSAEAISSMAEFVEEIRNVSAGISRFEADRLPLGLNELLIEVKTRVVREYSLAIDAISLSVEEGLTVLTNSLVKEMFWNIIDNSFKHKSQIVRILGTGSHDNVVRLEISDDAGGLPVNILEFLNNPESLSSQAAPGMGLGVILIKGLSILCGVKFKVDNVSKDGQSVGSVYKLDFERYLPLQA